MRNNNAIYTPKVVFFLFCRFISTICEQLLLFAIPLIIFQETGDASKSGLAFLIEWLPAVMLLPFIGVLADMFQEKKVYVIGDALRSIVCISSFGLLVNIPEHTFLILSITASLLAILNSQNFVALETTIAKNFSYEEIPRIQSLIQGLELASGVVGPALASVLVLVIKEVDFLLITSLAFVVTGFGVLGLPNKKVITSINPIRKERSFNQVFKSIGEGFEVIIKNQFLRLLVLATMLINLVMGTVLAINPAVVKGVLGASSQQYSFLGLFGGIMGTIVVLTLPIFLNKGKSIDVIGIISIVLLSISGMILGLSTTFISYVVGYAILICGIGVFNVFLRTERVKLIPKEHLGKSMGTIVFFNRLSLPLAGAIVAVCTKVVGPQQVVLGIAGIWILINAALFYYYFSKKKQNEKAVYLEIKN